MKRSVDLLLVAALVALFVICLLVGRVASSGAEESFAGADATVTDMISEDGHEPWFSPIFEPGSGEIESGLFALQAALGAGVLGYCAGRLHARRRQERAGAASR